jgi:bifunctional DNase/RNase
MIPVEVIGVRVEMPSNQPIVLLKESGSIRYLPIWVGAVEATAIAFAQQGIISPRPMTHDLLIQTLSELGSSIKEIHLTELRDGIFYANLNLSGGEVVSARPSDAIALALRTGSPILATAELFNQAGIEIPEAADDEVEKFKEFLDHVNPEDFSS